MRGAANGKARLPTVESLTEGTTRRLVPAERSVRRPCRSATGTSGPRYRGTLPCNTLYVLIDCLISLMVRIWSGLVDMTVFVTGPETWWIHYPSASGGMQSPIDIETEETFHDAEFGRSPLEVHYHLQAAHGAGMAEHGEGVDELWTLVNTGSSLQVNITNSQSCKSLHFTFSSIRCIRRQSK